MCEPKHRKREKERVRKWWNVIRYVYLFHCWKTVAFEIVFALHTLGKKKQFIEWTKTKPESQCQNSQTGPQNNWPEENRGHEPRVKMKKSQRQPMPRTAQIKPPSNTYTNATNPSIGPCQYTLSRVLVETSNREWEKHWQGLILKL